MIVFFTTTFSEPPSQLKVPIDGLSTTNTVGEALNVFCNKIGVRHEDVEVSLAEGVPVARLTLPLSSLQKSQPTDTNEQQDEELHLLAHCTVPLPVTVAQWDADIRKDAEEKTLIPPSPVANIVAVRPNRIHKSRGSTDALVERRDGNEEALPVATQPIVISEPLTDAGQDEDDVCSPVIKMMPDDRKTVLLAITNDGTHSVDEGNPLEPKIPTQEATVVARRNHQFTRLVSSAYPTIVRATAPRLAAAVARDPLLAHLCHTSPSLLTSARSSVASSTTGGDLSARSTPYQSQFSYYRACLAVAVRYGVLLGPSGDISQPIIPHGEDCPPEDWLAELDQDVQSCTSARTTSTTSDDVPLVALYSELAGVRHSCWPNCVLCINSTTRPYGASCRCSSLDGIAQGERITCLMKSVDSMGFFLLSPERRRAMLRRHYRVACDCNRCTNAAENAVEQSLTAIFFRPEAEKELCVDVLQQDFDKLNLLRESTMQLTLCDVDHRIVLERREARLVRLQEFLTKYTEDSPVLKLGVCHWRVNLARAAYLQEAALLIQRSDSFRSRMEDSAEDFFNLLEICEQQLTVEHLLIPPGHPYGLISYWCGNHIAGGNLRGALHAQPNMEEGRDLDSVAERINWEALERSDAAWRELRGGTSIPHALRTLMDAFADY